MWRAPEEDEAERIAAVWNGLDVRCCHREGWVFESRRVDPVRVVDRVG